MRRRCLVTLIAALACASPASAQEITIREVADISAIGVPNPWSVSSSPDGRFLAIMPQRRGDIWLLDRQAGAAPRPMGLGRISQFRWAPGGRELVFNRMDDEERLGIYTVGTEVDATVRRIATDLVDSYSPVYSPRGDSVAYVGTLGCHDWSECYRLMAVPSRGGEPRAIAADVGWTIDWSPDGWIYYGGGEGGSVTFYRIATAGGRAEQIASTGTRRNGPDIGLSPDNRFFGFSLAPEAGTAVHTLIIQTADRREVLRRELPPGIVPQRWTADMNLLGLRRGERPTVVEIEISALLPR